MYVALTQKGIILFMSYPQRWPRQIGQDFICKKNLVKFGNQALSALDKIHVFEHKDHDATL
jgi:hypothetical protein